MSCSVARCTEITFVMSTLSNVDMHLWSQALFIRQADKNSIIFHPDRIRRDVLAGRAAQHFAGGDVELRSVPGAGQDFSVEFAFVEGAADVRAVVGEGVDAAIDLRQADRLSIYFNRYQLAIVKLIQLPDFDKISHIVIRPYPVPAVTRPSRHRWRKRQGKWRPR